MQPNTAYVWIALYDDGTFLCEYENLDTENPVYHSFHDVDLSRCVGLVLKSLVPELRDVSVKIRPELAQRPIFVRRGKILLKFSEATEQNPLPQEFLGHIHIIGWQKTLEISSEKKNVSSYIYVFQDGSILVSDNDKEVM